MQETRGVAGGASEAAGARSREQTKSFFLADNAEVKCALTASPAPEATPEQTQL